MKNKTSVIKFLLCIFAAAAVVFSALFYHHMTARYEISEKSSIAMDTIVTQKIYAEEKGEEFLTVVKEITDNTEAKLSRFREKSSVALLNEKGFVEDSSLAAIIGELEKISKLTEGGFDITVGNLVDLWKIGEGNEKIPSQKEIDKALSTVGYERLQLKSPLVTAEQGTALDLGAVAKGWACDLIYSTLSCYEEVKGAVVSVGGSIMCYGDYNKKGDKWSVAIQHPRNEREFLGILRVDEGFISTSGDYERYFEKDGTRYHHILDGRTGYPADSSLISVTVASDSGMLSDALSTACFIVGKEKATELIEEYGCCAIFVDEQLNITTVGDIDFEKQ